jgi:hypothetical protein
MGDLELLQPNSRKSMSQVLEAWFGSFSESFNAIKVGRIESVNFSNQTVDVQILHKNSRVVFNKEELQDYPLLKAVPFVVLGGGGSNITFPISKGDNCLLLFCDYEIDRWWETGQNLPANYGRKHDLSDAFALVGVHSLVDLVQGYSQYVKLAYSDSSYIEVGDTITLNNDETTASGKFTAEELHANTAATGAFVSADGKTITVVDGIITEIS